MTEPRPVRSYRFGTFEADAGTGELRKQGTRIRLKAQPFQLLCLLLDRPGELLTREEIARKLWPEGTFVDFDHGVNSAVNRIREALGDTASNPRFVETLARRGYRFVAPVEQFPLAPNTPAPAPPAPSPQSLSDEAADPSNPEVQITSRILTSPHELPRASYPVVQTLFVLMQIMYLSFYVGSLANLAEIEDLFAALPWPTPTLNLLIVTAAILIPVRAFVLSVTLFHVPRVSDLLLRVWPFLLAFDLLWALSPFLLLHHINFGLALACAALLVYSPFAERSLILMGAGKSNRIL